MHSPRSPRDSACRGMNSRSTAPRKVMYSISKTLPPRRRFWSSSLCRGMMSRKSGIIPSSSMISRFMISKKASLSSPLPPQNPKLRWPFQFGWRIWVQESLGVEGEDDASRRSHDAAFAIAHIASLQNPGLYTPRTLCCHIRFAGFPRAAGPMPLERSLPTVMNLSHGDVSGSSFVESRSRMTISPFIIVAIDAGDLLAF